MTHNTYTRIQFQNAITERQRSADDRATARELAQPLPAPPTGNNYIDITTERMAWDTNIVRVNITFSDGCHDRSVTADQLPIVREWAADLGVTLN